MRYFGNFGGSLNIPLCKGSKPSFNFNYSYTKPINTTALIPKVLINNNGIGLGSDILINKMGEDANYFIQSPYYKFKFK